MAEVLQLNRILFARLNIKKKYKKYIKHFQCKEKNRGFIEYYNRRKIIPSFSDLDYIICRILVEYFLNTNFLWLKDEIEKITNPFCKVYVYRKVEAVLDGLKQEIIKEEKIRESLK